MEVIQILVAVGLLAGNAYFVAVEFSVTRARPTMVNALVADGAAGSKSFKHAVDHIDNYLSACQLGITICSIGLGITAEPLVKHALEGVVPGIGGIAAATVAFALAYFVVSMFHVVLGELSPKSLAIARTRSTGLLLLPPMRVFYLATKPVVDLFNWMGNLVLRPFGIPPASEAGHDPHSEDELRRLIAQSQEQGLLDPEEHEFAEGVFTFGDRRAREVMVARPDVATLAVDASPEDAARRIVATGHTRLPVCEAAGDLDRCVGVVHVLDLVGELVDGDGPADLRTLARPALRTSEATLLDELLRGLREQRRHLALVEDEHGTVVGLITLEDVLEEIVGDIRDEFDDEGRRLLEPEEGAVRVAGDASLRQVRDRLGLALGEHDQATIGGHVVELLGRVPDAGQELEVGGRRAKVLEVEGARVAALRFEPVADEDADREA